MTKYKAISTASIWLGDKSMVVEKGKIYDVDDAKIEKVLAKSKAIVKVKAGLKEKKGGK